MLRKLCVLPVDIRLAAHANHLRFRPRSYSYIGPLPVLDILDTPIADWNVVIKSVFDKVVGSLALIALSPVLILTALAIRLETPGPVLFRQKRYGFNNELIEVYKFRSMYADRLDAAASKLVTRDDPRVTARRALHSQDLDRRTAAALQCGLQGRPVARGAAAPRRSGESGGPAIRSKSSTAISPAIA